MKILITGATGFIGQHLITKLSTEKHACTCLVRNLSTAKKQLDGLSGIEFLEGDITRAETLKTLKEKSFDAIFHLAAALGDQKLSDDEIKKINYQGTQNLLENLNAGSLFIFCSTPGVQGFGHKNAKEEEAYNPRTMYESSKMLAEKHISDYCSTQNIPWIILRPDFVYGPGDFRRIPLYKKIQQNKMYVIGKGTSVLCPTYIKDVINAFMLCLKQDGIQNKIFNISSEPVTVNDYLSTIAQCCGRELPKVKIPLWFCNFAAFATDILLHRILKKDPILTKSKIEFLTQDHGTDNTKAKTLLNYSPEYPLAKGMRETINWAKQQNLI